MRCKRGTRKNKEGKCTPKIAFLFLTYGEIHPVWEEYTKDHSVYVHAKYPTEITNPYFNSKCIPTIPTEWGKMSIVDATLNLLRTAYTPTRRLTRSNKPSRSNKNKWFVLLSGDSYPLQPIHKLEEFLSNQPYSLFEPLGGNKTSQWWILNHQDVDTVIKKTTYTNKFTIKHPSNGAYDEFYFLSLLREENHLYSFTPYPVVYTKWLKGMHSHPMTFNRWMLTDKTQSTELKSFFLRKITPHFTTHLYDPQKELYIVFVGTSSNLPEHPPKGDLILVSLGDTVSIPLEWFNQCIYKYQIHWSTVQPTIEYLIHHLDIKQWNKVIVTTEMFDWSNLHQTTHTTPHHRIANQDCQVLSPKHPAYVFKSYKKIAFLFLTRGDINQPELWSRYFKGNEHRVSIYVHPKNPEEVKTPWLVDHIIPTRTETAWGQIVEAYLELMKEAVKDKDNVKFVTISESCVPLKSFDEFYDKVMEDDKTSYIKFLKMIQYDRQTRIATQPGYKEHLPFVKHLARFCLSSYHVHQLLEKPMKFFIKMPVGDEYFLTSLHPNKDHDHIVDWEITYDNWEDVREEIAGINDQIRSLYERNEKTGEDTSMEIKSLQAHRDNIGKNPRTYHTLTSSDITRAKKTHSFFWRKFTTMPLPWIDLP